MRVDITTFESCDRTLCTFLPPIGLHINISHNEMCIVAAATVGDTPLSIPAFTYPERIQIVRLQFL